MFVEGAGVVAGPVSPGTAAVGESSWMTGGVAGVGERGTARAGTIGVWLPFAIGELLCAIASGAIKAALNAIASNGICERDGCEGFIMLFSP